MSTDVLANLKPPELAAFYGRLADFSDQNRGDLPMSLAALFMRQWLKNRDSESVFRFDAPQHLRDSASIRDVLNFHRNVFLTKEKARLEGGVRKWVGVIPRLIGKAPYQKWDIGNPVSMEYESLAEIPLRYQFTENYAEQDLLHSLHGFQLKSYVTVTAATLPRGNRLKINFQLFTAELRDRYDWKYSEHLTVPNPDYGSKEPGAVAPTSRKIVVYHTNAKRLVDAGLVSWVRSS
jgi:hypothetical protein